MIRIFRLSTLFALAAIIVTIATACGTDSGEGRAARPAGDPVVFVFQRQVDPANVEATAAQVARIIEGHIDRPVDVVVPTSYGASVQAVVSGRAHVAYMSAIPFLLAREEAPFRVLLAEERNLRTDYDSIIVTRVDSGLMTLEDLRDKRVMWTSATSTSGYVMPYSRLVNEGLLEKGEDPANFFGSVNYAGGYDRALLAVMNGQADVTAVSDYTLFGDRAEIYSTPEMREELLVLTSTPGVPTHLVGIRSDLPEDLIEGIRSALLYISEQHPNLLADVYGASRFVEVEEDEHLAAAVEALENTGLSARALTR